MPAMDHHGFYELAATVASEISDAFRHYEGQKWEKVDGNERAVSFEIEAPSLKGQKVRDLNPGGYNMTGDFNSQLWSAGGQYVGRNLRGRTLHGIHYTPEIVNNEYTGKVVVSDGSSAWDYDL